jgi:hypothetical protein
LTDSTRKRHKKGGFSKIQQNQSMMEENKTATYFLRSRLFTYDIMKNLNYNISLCFF